MTGPTSSTSGATDPPPEMGEPGQSAIDPHAPLARNTSPSLIGPLLTWQLIQLSAMGLAASRIPLWIEYPATSEHWACHALVVFQTIAIMMLWPVLLPTMRHVLALAVSCGPMAVLAIVLSGNQAGPVVLTQGMLAGWMLTLWLIGWAVRSALSRQFMASLTTGLMLLPILWLYLAEEFSGHQPWTESTLGQIFAGPLLQGIWHLNGQPITPGVFLLGMVLGLTCIGALIRLVVAGRK